MLWPSVECHFAFTFPHHYTYCKKIKYHLWVYIKFTKSSLDSKSNVCYVNTLKLLTDLLTTIYFCVFLQFCVTAKTRNKDGGCCEAFRYTCFE